MKEYAWINQDTLKTIKQCLKETIIAIESGRSCVIDKTNPDINTRRLFIDLAIERGVKVRCIELLTPIHVCLHNNIYRCLKSDRKEVPRIAFSMFKKRYEKPSLEEGFASIEVLEFSANFECKDDEAEWLSARKI